MILDRAPQLVEHFVSLEGEGITVGRAALFIRTNECNLSCNFCDTAFSITGKHPAIIEDMTSKDYVNFLKSKYSTFDRTHVMNLSITGGEPLMWDMNLLTQKLKENNRKVHIETSGAYPLTGNWDWICLSPKKNKLPTQTVYDNAHELKVIIHNKHDFIFAEEQAEKVNEEAILFLQPEWSKKEQMTPLIVDYVMNNPKWRVSLQTHKYLNIP